LVPLNARIAQMQVQLDAARDEMHRLDKLAAMLPDPAFSSGVTAADDVATARRAARCAGAAADTARQRVVLLAGELHACKAQRQGVIDQYHDAAQAHLALISEASAGYWAANLRWHRGRTRALIKDLALPALGSVEWPDPTKAISVGEDLAQ